MESASSCAKGADAIALRNGPVLEESVLVDTLVDALSSSVDTYIVSEMDTESLIAQAYATPAALSRTSGKPHAFLG